MKVFQFSGGCDSLAALYTQREWWQTLVVLWCDTGAAYPETYELMAKICNLVPHFEVIKSDKHGWEWVNGTAVDVVPEDLTGLGALIRGEPKTLYTSYIRCCAANIWEPLDRASRQLGATHIIRGQRLEERRKAPIRSGHTDPTGIKYEFPIEDWTKAKVLDYCKEACPELLPAYYARGERTSHDCWDCVAYLDENLARIQNLPANKRQVVMARLHSYREALEQELKPLYEVLNG